MSGVERLFEPRGQRAELGVHRGQPPGECGLIAHFSAKRAGDDTQCVQKSGCVVRHPAERALQRLGELAEWQPNPGRFATRAGACIGTTREIGLQRFSVQLHHQPLDLLQRLSHLRGMHRDVGHLCHLQPHADSDRTLCQALGPGVATQVHAAGELRERSGRQVVRLVEDEQTVVDLGEQAIAQRRQQQVVVDHDHLRADQRLAALVVDAAVERRAVLAGAGRSVGRHRCPEVGGRLGVQRVAVAIPRTATQGLRDAGIELKTRRDLVRRAYCA